MASYLQVTHELLEGLYQDLERLQPDMPCLKSDAGARRNLLRLIIERKSCPQARLPRFSDDADKDGSAVLADKLRHAVCLLRRALPLIVEGGRFVKTDSATFAIEKYIQASEREGRA